MTEPYDSTPDTLDHIGKVQDRLDQILIRLTNRGLAHDASKLVEPEKSGFDAAPPIFSIEYESEEYKASRRMLKTALDHHYAVNSHHPEHYENGINGMSLLDIVEMLSDWKAGGERTKQGSMAQSLEINIQRFKIEPQLAAILANTVKELEW